MGEFERGSLSLEDGGRLTYAVYSPPTVEGGERALLLCLHPGWLGETPAPYYGENLLTTLFAPALQSSGAVIVAPDCPGPAWNHPKARDALGELTQELSQSYEYSAGLISLVGYSAGGWGTWYLMLQDPQRYSSAVLLATLPVIDPVERFEDNFEQAREISACRMEDWLTRVPDIPIYIIHSQDDELFPFSAARDASKKLSEHGKDVRFHPVEGVGHYDATGYVQSLRAAVPWLEGVWERQRDH